MSERAYTMSEIDALRQACEARWLFGTTRQQNYSQHGGCGGNSRVFYREEKTNAVEQMVRTYMSAGITAKDIYEQDAK